MLIFNYRANVSPDCLADVFQASEEDGLLYCSILVFADTYSWRMW
jgi:hypothetical protein